MTSLRLVSERHGGLELQDLAKKGKGMAVAQDLAVLAALAEQPETGASRRDGLHSERADLARVLGSGHLNWAGLKGGTGV
jgi:hypothetical protein